MRQLTPAEISELGEDLHRVMWTWARRRLELEPTQPPLLASDGPAEVQKESYLCLVALGEQVRELAERVAASAAEEAGRRGAGYPELGAAAGISRQAARKRWPGVAVVAGRRRRAVWKMPEGTGPRGLSEASRREMTTFDIAIQ
jgi:hypothetical protein